MKRLRITVEGKTYEVEVEAVGEEPTTAQTTPKPTHAASIAAPAAPVSPTPTASAGQGDVPSPLSGTVVSIDVKIGQKVAAGDALITLEAMKMNTMINAPTGGTVSAIHVQTSQSVEEGLPLLTLS